MSRAAYSARRKRCCARAARIPCHVWLRNAGERGEAVRVPDVQYEVYRALLDYLLSDYLAEPCPPETLLELMMLANAYGIVRLEQLCARKLARRLDASNVNEIGRCACLIGEHHLHRAAGKFNESMQQQAGAPMATSPTNIKPQTPFE